MKKLLLSIVALAFAVAVQAGEGKNCDKAASAACCTKGKADQAKAACCSSTKGAACKEAAGKQALLSPKAAAEQGKTLASN